MITFAVTSYRPTQDCQLVYRRDEFSFGTECAPGGRGISVVVNDLELFVDDEGQVLYVSGYCPYQGWEPTSSFPPEHSGGGLKVVGIDFKNEQTGMAFRLNDLNSRWPAYLNAEGWVCIGDPGKSGDHAVEFAHHCVAVLIRDSLVALWLRPLMQGGD